MTAGVRLKSVSDIAAIWRSGQIASRLHLELRERLKPGVLTAELNAFAHEFILAAGATPSFLGYRVGKKEYPSSICVSINDEVVHGIPGQRRIAAGDVVSIDLGVTLAGYIADTACTWFVTGDGVADDAGVPAELRRLLQGTQRSLAAGIAAVRPEATVRHVSRAIHDELLAHRLAVIRDLTGHGVGFHLHEEPTIYNFDTGMAGAALHSGVVLALEPMATLGSESILLASDNWTYKTADGSLAAHFEHTVALWDGRAFVLTDHNDNQARAAFEDSV